MLLAAMYFWEVSTNTFQQPCGMITPVLFYLVAIIGLWHNGEDYEPSVDTDFKISIHVYTAFIIEHRGSGNFIDTREHITFLTYWLCRYIFCPRGIQINKMHISMATQLHEWECLPLQTNPGKSLRIDGTCV